MSWLVVAVAALIIYGMVTRTKRAARIAETTYVKVIDASNKKQITYETLAKKRHNIHTAKNLIALGLIQSPRHSLERAIQAAYDGIFEPQGTWAGQIARNYGLNPDAPNFVGF